VFVRENGEVKEDETGRNNQGRRQLSMARRIKVKGVKKSELSPEDVALAYWLLAKRELKIKREREAKERNKRRGRQS
jgi:hypothetical protein